jgi:DNA-binding GntR family transcriptional regulator
MSQTEKSTYGSEDAIAATEDRESLTSRLHVLIRKDIIMGVLEPGSKLKIEDLRKRYDSGASPVREALSLLTSNRLVERIDQRGFRVTPIGLDEFDELLKTRCWLEERALRESIANGSTRWEEELVIATFRLSRMPRGLGAEVQKTSEDWEALHKSYHMLLLSQCRSRFLVDICDDLYDHNVRYRQAARGAAYPERDVKAEHDAITDAVLHRDADLAVSRLIEHYRATGMFLRKELS